MKITYDKIVARNAAYPSQAVFFTITDEDDKQYNFHSATPILEGQDLDNYLDQKKRDYMANIYRHMYLKAELPIAEPGQDSYDVWRTWIDNGCKNVSTVPQGQTKDQQKLDWIYSESKWIEVTKSEATEQIIDEIDDPSDKGVATIVGYIYNENGDGEIVEVTNITKRKIQRKRTIIKDQYKFNQTTGKFMKWQVPSKEDAELIVVDFNTKEDLVIETIIEPVKFKHTW
jgi:hypothetical protein